MSAHQDGYYWALHRDGSTFVVLRQLGVWYCAGVEPPMVNFEESQIIEFIDRPVRSEIRKTWGRMKQQEN